MILTDNGFVILIAFVVLVVIALAARFAPSWLTALLFPSQQRQQDPRVERLLRHANNLEEHLDWARARHERDEERRLLQEIQNARARAAQLQQEQHANKHM
ncbi:MAG: hypothetical protein MHM6MM_002276 [Cercozoa sp. M6MM]